MSTAMFLSCLMASFLIGLAIGAVLQARNGPDYDDNGNFTDNDDDKTT